MTKRVVCLSLLLLAFCGVGVYAQSISQYEYWTDDEYATRSVVDAGASDISLTISTEALGAGVHFLNFRAKGNDGTWGNFCRYMYYIPTLKNDASGSLSLDYWLDDDNAGQKSKDIDNDNVALTLDISALKPGVHYFNCTPISTTSGRGNSERYIFYVPMSSSQATVSAVKGYEYWFDDNYSAVIKKQAEAGEQVLSLSLTGLSSGVHYFNCRAINERGEYGCPVREMFYVPQTEINTEAKIAKSVYWLDDDYEHRKEIASENTDHAFSIDISKLASGVHYFNYRAADNKGVWGSIIRQMFYISRSDQPATSGNISYEYWLDDDTSHKVTGNGNASEYVFSIDISSLDEGSHTFNFRAKDQLDQWGETFVSTFVIDNSIPDFLKVDNVWYQLDKEKGEAMAIETRGLEYEGDINIPATFKYNGSNFKVTSISNFAFRECTKLNSVVIGDSVTQIGTGAFAGCNKLVTLDIGSSIKTFGDNAFSDCNHLSDVYCHSEEIPYANSSVFNTSYIKYATLHVPAKALKLYREAVTWKNFGSIVPIDIIKGDTNGDCEVDIADAVYIVNYVVGKPTPWFVTAAADVNNDGDIDIADAVGIVNLVVGKIPSFARSKNKALPEPE